MVWLPERRDFLAKVEEWSFHVITGRVLRDEGRERRIILYSNIIIYGKLLNDCEFKSEGIATGNNYQ